MDDTEDMLMALPRLNIFERVRERLSDFFVSAQLPNEAWRRVTPSDALKRNGAFIAMDPPHVDDFSDIMQRALKRNLTPGQRATVEMIAASAEQSTLKRMASANGGRPNLVRVK